MIIIYERVIRELQLSESTMRQSQFLNLIIVIQIQYNLVFSEAMNVLMKKQAIIFFTS